MRRIDCLCLFLLAALCLFSANASAEEYAAGTVLYEEQAQDALLDPEGWFTAEPIGDEVFSRIEGKTYPEDCPIPLDELRYLKLLHYNFDHEIQVGELIVNTALADEVLEIFRELFDAEYEIYSMYLPETFWDTDALTTDEASIEANNTSAFSYRVIASSGNLSNHARGRAIDINPLQNPYLEFDTAGNVICDHEASWPYLDRTGGLDHMITYDDPAYQLFAGRGYTWGGSWSNPVDYQHFEKSE